MANRIINKDTTLSFIRDELRDEISFNRKQNREVNLNKNRWTLGKSIDENEYTIEFVVTTAKNLRKKSLTIEEYRKLQNALIQSENNINSFFKVDNALHGLIRDLSGKSVQSKLAAANCCCNLALGNSKACVTISKFAAPYLLAELESTNQPLAETCAWTIGNLAIGSDKAFSILHSQGCMKSLISLAKQCSDLLLPSISYACLRYLQTGIDKIETEDMVELGETIANRRPQCFDKETIWLLALLSSTPKSINYLLKCIPVMSDYFVEAILRDEDDVEKISAVLRIICNTVSEPTGQVIFYLFKDNIDENRCLLNKLLSNQHVHIRKETLWLIGNLYNHCLDNVRQLIKTIIISLPALNLAINSLDQ